jgi:hypothetical protein
MAVLYWIAFKPLRHLAVAAVGVWLLAACESPTASPDRAKVPEPPPAPPTAAASEPAPPKTPMAPVPARKPQAPPTREQLQALGVAEARRLTSGSVIGLEFDEVHRLLGEPALRLDEPPARIWQYQTAECTLRLTFFPEVKTQRYRSLSVALRNTDEDTEDARSRCLNAIHANVRQS